MFNFWRFASKFTQKGPGVFLTDNLSRAVRTITKMDQILSYGLKVLKLDNMSKLETSIVAEEMEAKCPSVREYFPAFEDMAIFFATVLPQIEPDVSRMAELALFAVWICVYDDKCEKGEEYCTMLLDIINGVREASADISAEMLYIEAIKHIFDKLEENTRERIMKYTILNITTMHQEYSINFDEISLDQFMEFRIYNVFCPFYQFIFEYGLHIFLMEELLKTNEMKSFFNDFNKWTVIAQNLLSFIKDNDNYLYVKLARSKFTLEEGVKECIEELDQFEIKIDQHFNTLSASGLGIHSIFIETVQKFMNMYVRFHKYAARFKQTE